MRATVEPLPTTRIPQASFRHRFHPVLMSCLAGSLDCLGQFKRDFTDSRGWATAEAATRPPGNFQRPATGRVFLCDRFKSPTPEPPASRNHHAHVRRGDDKRCGRGARCLLVLWPKERARCRAAGVKRRSGQHRRNPGTTRIRGLRPSHNLLRADTDRDQPTRGARGWLGSAHSEGRRTRSAPSTGPNKRRSTRRGRVRRDDDATRRSPGGIRRSDG